MIRALWIFFVVAVFAISASIIADLPGDITIALPDVEIRASVPAILAGLILLAVASVLVYRLINALLDIPGDFFEWRAMGRRRRGFVAVTRGLVAVAAGDNDEAKRQTRKANALVGEPPLALLLAAQTAQLEGDEEQAQRYFTQMLQVKETEFLGLRGLFISAMRNENFAQAITIAQRARQLRPKTRWASTSLFDLNVRLSRWMAANDALDNLHKQGLLDASVLRRRKGVLFTAMSQDADQQAKAHEALALATQALTVLPGFAPAALIAARHYSAQGRYWKAATLIETAWSQDPNPDIAKAYANLKPEEPPTSREQRLYALLGMNPEHPESQILKAALAISAKRFDEAKEALRPQVEVLPSVRACLLMSDIERALGGNSLMAQEWANRALQAPRDAQWTCGECSRTSPAWTPVCSACGAFDTVAWQSGWHGQPELTLPNGSIKTYADLTATPSVLYKNTVKLRPGPGASIEHPSPPVPEDDLRSPAHVKFTPPSTPDDPGPGADDFMSSGNEKHKNRGSAW